MAQLDVVDCALNCSTTRMAEDQDKFGAFGFTGKFHATEDVVINDIACHASIKEVSDTKVHDYLGCHPGINAAQHNSFGVLSGGGGLLVLQGVPD